MRIVVVADGITQKEFQDKEIPAGVSIQLVATIAEAGAADAIFYLLEEDDLQNDLDKIRSMESLFFVNAVTKTLRELPGNCVRICGWRGFFLQDKMEICASEENLQAATRILNGLQWQSIQVPDIIGMVAPRVTALLINEAYAIIGNDVSQKESVETAIKLAANFSGGPFEISEKIGLQKIFNLLVHLTTTNERYTPAALLKKEITDLGANS